MQLSVVWFVLIFGVSDCADFASVRLHLGESRLLRQCRTEQNTPLLTCSIRCYSDLTCMAVNNKRETQACELNDRNGFYSNYRSEGQVGGTFIISSSVSRLFNMIHMTGSLSGLNAGQLKYLLQLEFRWKRYFSNYRTQLFVVTMPLTPVGRAPDS